MPSSEKQERIQGQGGATPGPWHAHPDGSMVEYETGIGGRRTLLSLNWRGPVETAANAKLIAAAPKMADTLALILPLLPADSPARRAVELTLREAGRE